MIISAALMTAVNINYKMSNEEVYKRARDMGMNYPDGFKVINNGGAKK